MNRSIVLGREHGIFFYEKNCFESRKVLSEFDWSEFDNHAHRNIAPEQMMLSSNTFNNCSVNICFNTK